MPFYVLRLFALSSVLLLATLAAAIADDQEKSAPPKPPRARLTLSRDVTYFTEPLGDDGLIDYAAALNAHYGQGITIENNAAVALVRAAGRDYTEPKEFAEICTRLGIDPLPDDGEYFISHEKYIAALAKEFYNDRDKVAKRLNLSTEVLEQHIDRTDWSETLDRCEQAPWSAEKEPLVAAWLAANAKSLEQFCEASRKQRFFVPMKSGDAFAGMLGSSNVLLPAMKLVDALRVRAMLSLAAGKTEDAWNDALALRRWGARACETTLLIDQLVGNVFGNVARSTAVVIASHGNADEATLRKMLDEWNDIQPKQTLAEAFDVGERAFGLSAMNVLVRVGGDPDWIRSLEGIGHLVPEEASESRWRRVALGVIVDWDEAYRVVNRHYDTLVRIAKLPPGKGQRDVVAEYEQAMRRAEISKANPALWFTIATLPHEARRKATGRLVGMYFAAMVLPDAHSLVTIENRSTVHERLLHVAFALARHRAVRGAYPARLDQLVPVYLTELPADDFGDGPPKYRRTRGGGFLLYSVGANGKDENGQSNQPLVDTTPNISKEEPPADDDAPISDEAQRDDLVIRIGPPHRKPLAE